MARKYVFRDLRNGITDYEGNLRLIGMHMLPVPTYLAMLNWLDDAESIDDAKLIAVLYDGQKLAVMAD